MTLMTRVDLYARISDDQEGDSFGVENQLKALREHASEKGWEVGRVFRDDSISATSGKRRPGFEDLLARRSPDPVLVWNTDRLVRLSRDLERVLDTGITVYAIQAGTFDLATPNGRAMARMATAMATAEVENKTARQLLANQARAAQGLPYWRRRPYGHTLDGQVVPQEADVLRGVARDVIEGVPLRQIAMALTEEHGLAWTPNNLGKKLRNPRMAGRLTYQGREMPESRIAPILDESTWLQLSSILDNPDRRSSSERGGSVNTLLSGIARCGICDDGTTHHAASVHREGVNTPVYRCKAKAHCAHIREGVDEHVAMRTVTLLTTGEASGLLDDPDHDDSATVEEVKAVQAQLAEWQEVAAEIGPREYVAVTRPLKARLAELDEQMRERSRASIIGDFLMGDEFRWSHYSDAMGMWRSLPLMRQREIVAALWDVTLLRRTHGDAPFEADRVAMTRR